MKTYSLKASDIDHKWYVVDAQDKILGRLAAEIALRLRGKHKADYAPHMDNGDYIIVVNADKIRVTGKKMAQKVYYRHSHHIGGIKGTVLKDMLRTKPTDVLRKAVRGMLPKGPLGYKLIKKLRIYNGTEHPHTAQQPQPLDL